MLTPASIEQEFNITTTVTMIVLLYFFVWALVSADFVCLGVLWHCSACLQMSYCSLCIRYVK